MITFGIEMRLRLYVKLCADCLLSRCQYRFFMRLEWVYLGTSGFLVGIYTRFRLTQENGQQSLFQFYGWAH